MVSPHPQRPQQEQQHLYIPAISHHFAIIVPLPSLTSCFIRLSGPPSAAALWQQRQCHFCRVLQLQKLSQQHQKPLFDIETLQTQPGAAAKSLAESAAAVGTPKVYVGWIGAGLTSADAAAVREAATAAAGAGVRVEEAVCIGIAAPLCALLDLTKGEIVIAAAVDVGHLEQQQQQLHTGWPYISSLEVAPLGRDDWDAVQLHAEALEEEVLDQVALLMPQQTFPLWIGGNSKPAVLRVCTPKEGDEKSAQFPPFFLLSQNTELHVRPLSQAAFRRGPMPEQSDLWPSGSGKRTECMREILRVLPLREEHNKNGTKPKFQRCGYCNSATGGRAAQGSWQYVCCLHPAHVTALQQQQQWLLPTLRSGQQLRGPDGPPSSRTHQARLERLHKQRVAAAEAVALVYVRRAPACGAVAVDPSKSWEKDSSHALLLAVAAADVPLGCVRVPAFVRRLYGWAISSRVAVEPCRQVPTLPNCLLLTPLVSFPPCLHYKDNGIAIGARRWLTPGTASRSIPIRVAAFLLSEEGRRRLREAFLGLTDIEEGEAEGDATTPPPFSGNSFAELPHSAETAGFAFRSLLGCAVWDGAIVRLRVPVSLDELDNEVEYNTAEARHKLYQQQEQLGMSTVAEGSGSIGGNSTPHCVRKSSVVSEQKGSGGPQYLRLEEQRLGAELRELEAGLVDLYLSSDAEDDKEGEDERSHGSQLLEEPCRAQAGRASGTGEQAAADNARQAQKLPDWARLATTCSVVEELSLSSSRGSLHGNDGDGAPAAGSIGTGGISNSLLKSQGCSTKTSSTTKVLHIPVDIIVSFNATGKTASEVPSDEPSIVQRCLSPRFSCGLPLIFSGLRRGHPPLGLEVDCGHPAWVLLGASFRSVIRQGSVALEVTQPVTISIGRSSPKEGGANLCLPLRIGSSSSRPDAPLNPNHSNESLSDSAQMQRQDPSAPAETGTGLQLALDARAIEVSQRLWWLMPYSLVAPQASAGALSMNGASGMEAQLLQLLQQGCVDVPSAELPLGLCSCEESHSPSPLGLLFRMSCSEGPLLEDFKGLRAFGEHPAALTRAGKQWWNCLLPPFLSSDCRAFGRTENPDQQALSQRIPAITTSVV